MKYTIMSLLCVWCIAVGVALFATAIKINLLYLVATCIFFCGFIPPIFFEDKKERKVKEDG